MKWFAGFFDYSAMALCMWIGIGEHDSTLLVAAGLFAIAVQLWKE